MRVTVFSIDRGALGNFFPFWVAQSDLEIRVPYYCPRIPIRSEKNPENHHPPEVNPLDLGEFSASFLSITPSWLSANTILSLFSLPARTRTTIGDDRHVSCSRSTCAMRCPAHLRSFSPAHQCTWPLKSTHATHSGWIMPQTSHRALKLKACWMLIIMFNVEMARLNPNDWCYSRRTGGFCLLFNVFRTFFLL